MVRIVLLSHWSAWARNATTESAMPQSIASVIQDLTGKCDFMQIHPFLVGLAAIRAGAQTAPHTVKRHLACHGQEVVRNHILAKGTSMLRRNFLPRASVGGGNFLRVLLSDSQVRARQ